MTKTFNQPDSKVLVEVNQERICDKCPRGCRPLMVEPPPFRFDPVEDAPQIRQFLHPSGKCWVRAMTLEEVKRLAKRYDVDYQEILKEIRADFSDKLQIMGDYLVYTWRFFPKDKPPSKK